MLSGEFSQLYALLEDARGGDNGLLQFYELSKATEIRVYGALLALILSWTPPLQEERVPRVPYHLRSSSKYQSVDGTQMVSHPPPPPHVK